jgi:hypothetical protein
VIKELVDMLKDTMFEDFEKYIWENTSHPHQKPKEEGHNKDKEADDVYLLSDR